MLIFHTLCFMIGTSIITRGQVYLVRVTFGLKLNAFYDISSMAGQSQWVFFRFRFILFYLTYEFFLNFKCGNWQVTKCLIVITIYFQIKGLNLRKRGIKLGLLPRMQKRTWLMQLKELGLCLKVNGHFSSNPLLSMLCRRGFFQLLLQQASS